MLGQPQRGILHQRAGDGTDTAAVLPSGPAPLAFASSHCSAPDWPATHDLAGRVVVAGSSTSPPVYDAHSASTASSSSRPARPCPPVLPGPRPASTGRAARPASALCATAGFPPPPARVFTGGCARPSLRAPGLLLAQCRQTATPAASNAAACARCGFQLLDRPFAHELATSSRAPCWLRRRSGPRCPALRPAPTACDAL